MIKRRYLYRCEREHQNGRGRSEVCGTFFNSGLFQMSETKLFRQAIEFAEESDTFQNEPSDKPIFVLALNRI